MKNKLIVTTLLLASAFTTSVIVAQDAEAPGRPGRPPGGPGGPGRGMRPPPFIAALDANKDGKIDATELANSSSALAKLDKNGDGNLSADEIRPARPADAPEPPADAPKRPMPPVFAALDVDADKAISASELANAPTVLAKLDKNSDGVLTPDEFMGRERGGPGGHGRGPGGPGRGPRPDAAKE